MITHEEILGLGFEYMEDWVETNWSDEETMSYRYTVNRTDKPSGSQNIYRLSRIVDTDYFNLASDLERLPEFKMFTRGWNGDLEDISDLFYLFESFKEANRKI